MSVYVDGLADNSAIAAVNGKGWKYGPNCHMIADTIPELIAFAESIGLRRSWFQSSPPSSIPHFDLTAGKRRAAIRGGAIEMDRRTFFAKVNELRESGAWKQ